jgi:hypothetical protein
MHEKSVFTVEVSGKRILSFLRASLRDLWAQYSNNKKQSAAINCTHTTSTPFTLHLMAARGNSTPSSQSRARNSNFRYLSFIQVMQMNLLSIFFSRVLAEIANYQSGRGGYGGACDNEIP